MPPSLLLPVHSLIGCYLCADGLRGGAWPTAVKRQPRQPGWQSGGEWIRVAESLCCSPGTITALLISYTPIQNKKLKKIKESRPWPLPTLVEFIV